MSLRVLVVTPAPPGSRSGNRITALRWARLLREAGHDVVIAERFDRQRCDVLIALHARRSHASIARFRRLRHDCPLILAMTGTDLYDDIHHDAKAQESLTLADRIIVLQEAGRAELPLACREATHVVVQSVRLPKRLAKRLARPRGDRFEVCVVGHLREVKDPFRAAEAARLLPDDSGVRIEHAGGALSEVMATRARDEMRHNKRYEWLGELSHAQALRLIARCRVMVLSSQMEGGANVICEALACGTPVISSQISGSVGLLGRDYGGYFAFGDTAGLAAQLRRCETSAAYLDELTQACRRRAYLVDPAHERHALTRLLDGLT